MQGKIRETVGRHIRDGYKQRLPIEFIVGEIFEYLDSQGVMIVKTIPKGESLEGSCIVKVEPLIEEKKIEILKRPQSKD